MSKSSKFRCKVLCVVCAAFALAVVLAMAGKSAVDRLADTPQESDGGFLDKLGEIGARYAAEDDAVHALSVSKEEKARRWDDNSRRRMAEVRALYERHGKTPPPGH